MKKITKKILTVVTILCVLMAATLPVFAAVTPCRLSIVDFKEREVLSYSYTVDKNVEGDNVGNAAMGTMTIRVKAMRDGTQELFYFANENLVKDGWLTVMDTRTGKEMKKIEFYGATCINYKEKYSAELGNYEEIELAVSEFKWNDVSLENVGTATTIANKNGGDATLAVILVVVLAAAGAVAGIVVNKKKIA